MTIKTPILRVKNISKSFQKAELQELRVLNNINFDMGEGEIVALLGKSGSGKSTLLRIIAGLVAPSAGNVMYRGKSILGPVHGIAMVFQSFALLPWLTVLQNVELGLEAQGVPPEERRLRALKAIDTIGLDGFESAFPKELSGGMRQRVGFARALVVNPDVLLMDEPFSALDVLTADNLKNDLLDLWQTKQTNTNAILFVTHNIEEAVYLADRIIVFGSNPGYIRAEVPVQLTHPRNEQDPIFRQLVDHMYTLMTTENREVIPFKLKQITMAYRLPDTDISELTGLVEAIQELEENKEKIDLPELADWLNLNVDDLFPVIEVLEILDFAKVSKGDIALTLAGKKFANADILERKKIFAAHLLKYVPLAAHMRRVLDERRGHRAAIDRFLAELEDFLTEEEADRVLRVAIEWGRYAEILAYNNQTGILSLENPH